jgi:hypothetical protein
MPTRLRLGVAAARPLGRGQCEAGEFADIVEKVGTPAFALNAYKHLLWIYRASEGEAIAEPPTGQ